MILDDLDDTELQRQQPQQPQQPPATIVLTTRRAKYQYTFDPVDEVELTGWQASHAGREGVTHAIVPSDNGPEWLSRAAAEAGYRAVRLGYTRGRAGYITRSVWGLVPYPTAWARVVGPDQDQTATRSPAATANEITRTEKKQVATAWTLVDEPKI